VAHARALKHHHSLAVALLFSSFVHLVRRDLTAAQSVGLEAFEISTERGIPQWGPMAQAQVGAAIAAQGDPHRGLVEIDRGLAGWTRLGARLVVTWFLGLRAEALLLSGRENEVFATIDDALKIGGETGERMYEAELYRLRGEAAFTTDPPSAERDFRRAIDVARELSAKSLELRASTSLARFMDQRGQRDDARELLTHAYAWFTQGLDTGDLRAARALLDNLGKR
jgi:predicted ATPase